eukprot:7130532-Heterocapsa_arctica.AAC.1
MFSGPGLQMCVFRLGEKAPRSTLTIHCEVAQWPWATKCVFRLGEKAPRSTLTVYLQGVWGGSGGRCLRKVNP